MPGGHVDAALCVACMWKRPCSMARSLRRPTRRLACLSVAYRTHNQPWWSTK